MQTVRQILSNKGNDVWTINKDARVVEAIGLMAEKNVGAILVVDGKDTVGIISERDYTRADARPDKIAKEMYVHEIMTPDPICVKVENTAAECMALMTDKYIRHLPVLDNDEMVGLISIGDVVKSVISHQEFTIHQLESYITGGKT